MNSTNNSQLSLPNINIFVTFDLSFLSLCSFFLKDNRYDAPLLPKYSNACFLRAFSAEPQYNNQNQEAYIDTVLVSKLYTLFLFPKSHQFTSHYNAFYNKKGK